MANLIDEFTICVLLFGDYPQLAERCLDSLVRFLPPGGHLRVGMNRCGVRTQDVVKRVLHAHCGFQSIELFVSTANVHKYPMMRHMFYDPGREITTPYVMWFDDDSFLLPPGGMPWLESVRRGMDEADMIGAIYSGPLCQNQHLWIRDQPWYRGKPVEPGQRVYFVQGAWWTIRTAVLKQLNWPVRPLDHCGGDLMLGEVFRQQELKMYDFDDAVAINADDEGHQSAAPRRGFNQLPVGWDYLPKNTARLDNDAGPDNDMEPLPQQPAS